MASPASSSNHLLRSGWTPVLPAMGAVGTRTCLVVLAGLSLAACRHRDEQSLVTDHGPGLADGMQQSAEARMRPDAHEPRKHARSHVLLGIDFSRPLKLPECARFYTSFDRPETTCVYLRSLDHKPFKVEFKNGSVPDFLKWDNAMISTDERGRPQMIRFEIGDEPALRGKAVDAMLEKFGPPTSVENAGSTSKIGTWRHEDYVIQYFFDPGGGGSVQMETRKFHDAPPVPAAVDEAHNAKL